MAARPTAIAVSGRPFSPRSIGGRPSPRIANNPQLHHPSSDGGTDHLLSSFICGAGSDQPFVLCDSSTQNNEVDFDINPTGVYLAVHTKQWNLASERVKLYPHEASTWVVRYFNNNNADNSTSGVEQSSMTDTVAMASPRSGVFAMSGASNNNVVIRWRMLPLHASLLFGGPIELVRALVKACPTACRMQDDQGMLPLHVAFRFGASEDIVVLLLDAYPEAIEQVDHKGRLPSMLSPKDALSYSNSIGEAFIRGPAYYYWSARVSAAQQNQSEVAMMAKIKEIEVNARTSNEISKDILEKTEKQLTDEIEALSIENVELKERLNWYETKYDGADEKQKVLVDHANSLAERLRLTSLSEEHLATKLAKLEGRMHSTEAKLEENRRSSTGAVQSMESQVSHLQQTLTSKEGEAKSLSKKLEKKIAELNEMKLRLEKERQLFEKQLDTSKECLQELVASSKEDKRLFEEETKALREQMVALQNEVKQSSVDEKRILVEDSQAVRNQLLAIQSEVQKQGINAKTVAPNSSATITLPKSLEDRLDKLQRELANNATVFMSRLNGMEAKEEKRHTNVDAEGRFDRSMNEPISVRSSINRNSVQKKSDPKAHASRGVTKQRYQSHETIDVEDWGVESIDTYVSTRSITSSIIEDDQARDDVEVFDNHFSNQGDMEALGVLTEEQRIALERLDLSGGRVELTKMLGKVPGLTKKQVNLLVDVASSLSA